MNSILFRMEKRPKKQTLQNVCQFSQQAWGPPCACVSEKLRCIWTLTLIWLLRVHECTGGSSMTRTHWSLQRESCGFWLSLKEKEEKDDKEEKQERYDKYFRTKPSWPLFVMNGAQDSFGTNTYDQVMSSQKSTFKKNKKTKKTFYTKHVIVIRFI